MGDRARDQGRRRSGAAADLGALPERDYAVHGGSVPILLQGAGCVGAVTVSGLPQRDDHRIVVEAMAKALGRDIADIALD